jgi:hypothetical protein
MYTDQAYSIVDHSHLLCYECKEKMIYIDNMDEDIVKMSDGYHILKQALDHLGVVLQGNEITIAMCFDCDTVSYVGPAPSLPKSTEKA